MRRPRSDSGPRIEFEEPDQPREKPAQENTWSDDAGQWRQPDDWGGGQDWEERSQTWETRQTQSDVGWTPPEQEPREDVRHQTYTDQTFREPDYREPAFQEQDYREPPRPTAPPREPAFRGQAWDYQPRRDSRDEYLDDEPRRSVWRRLLWVFLVMVAILTGLVIYSLVSREPPPATLKPAANIVQPDNAALTSRIEVLENRVLGLEERLKKLEAKTR